MWIAKPISIEVAAVAGIGTVLASTDTIPTITLVLVLGVVGLLLVLTTIIIMALLRFHSSAEKVESAICDLSASVKTMAKQGTTINNVTENNGVRTRDVGNDVNFRESS